jgi:hypothetical protein
VNIVAANRLLLQSIAAKYPLQGIDIPWPAINFRLA